MNQTETIPTEHEQDFAVDTMRKRYLKVDGNPPKPSDKTVFHYTSLDVLNEMCKEDGDLLCTHFMSLNDSQEFFFGANIVLNKLPAILSRMGIQRQKLGSFRQNAYDKVLQRLREETLAPWITSFSSDPDSLYQWVAYTDRKQGGVAIGFNTSLLYSKVEGVQKNPQLNKLIGCRLEKCQYTDNVNLDSYIHSVVTSMINQSTNNSNKDRETSILAAVYVLASTIKNHSFSQEKESRLILLPTREEALRRYKFVGGKPRIATEFFGKKRELAKAISSVVISPHGDRDKLVSTVNLLRQQYGLKFQIYQSDSSYNGR